jgi:multidrug resistance efflux pump
MDEKAIDQLRVGQPATIEIDAFPGRTNSGKVTAVSATAELFNPAARDVKRYAVIVSLDDPPAQAKLGLTATVEIKVRAEKTE